jgi:hypothetical protein
MGAVSGGMLAPHSIAGPWAGAGFFALAVAWFSTTAAGLLFAIQRRFREHRASMLFSFGLTLAGVTLRLYLLVPSILGLDFMASYRVIAWACWVPNLLVCALYSSSLITETSTSGCAWKRIRR